MRVAIRDGCGAPLCLVTVPAMEIAPQKFGDTLNTWFRALGSNWKNLLLSSLVVHVPLGVVVMFVFWMTGAAEYFDILMDPDLDTMPTEEVLEALIPMMWTIGIWAVLQIPAAAFVYLAAARSLAGDMAGNPMPLGEVIRFAAARTLTGIGLFLAVLAGGLALTGVAIALGWVLIASGGANFLTVFVTTVAGLTALVVLAWLGLSVSLGLPVIAMEDMGVIAALTRSFSLVQGRWWITLGYVALAGIISSAASQLVSVVLVPVFLVGVLIPEMTAMGFGLSALLQGPLLAAIAAAYVVWYVDLRARSEPLLAEQLVEPT